MQTADIEALRTQLSGAVLTRGDTEARSARNGQIDRYPAVIARCAGAADVAAAIGFARQGGLEISVRGGFHNTAGTAICDDGLMIDLSPLHYVEVDPAADAPGSVAAPSWELWMLPLRHMVWRYRPGLSAIPAWAAWRWAAGWVG